MRIDSRKSPGAGVPRTGLPAGLVAIAGGALMVIGSFLTWLSTATLTGGRTSVSGFGVISGDSTLAGGNLNDALSMGGLGSFRPGLIGLIFGVLAMLTGTVVAARRPGPRHPFRIAGALLALAGVAGLGWGLYRGFVPGSGGILAPGEGSAGAGEWMTAGGGLVAVGAACWLLSGRADLSPADPAVRHHGIQR